MGRRGARTHSGAAPLALGGADGISPKVSAFLALRMATDFAQEQDPNLKPKGRGAPERGPVCGHYGHRPGPWTQSGRCSEPEGEGKGCEAAAGPKTLSGEKRKPTGLLETQRTKMD